MAKIQTNLAAPLCDWPWTDLCARYIWNTTLSCKTVLNRGGLLGILRIEYKVQRTVGKPWDKEHLHRRKENHNCTVIVSGSISYHGSVRDSRFLRSTLQLCLSDARRLATLGGCFDDGKGMYVCTYVGRLIPAFLLETMPTELCIICMYVRYYRILVGTVSGADLVPWNLVAQIVSTFDTRVQTSTLTLRSTVLYS